MTIIQIESIKTIRNKIDELIKRELYDEAYNEYQLIDTKIKRMEYIISETNQSDREIAAKFYSSYAYFVFGFEKYDEFFEMYIKAQQYGYSFKKRREFIYKSFIEPNLESFKLNYVSNIENMKTKGCILEGVEFESLPLWLVTTGNENEYYLYEKEKDLISNKIILDINNIKLSRTELPTILEDSLIVNDDCWTQIQSHVNENNSQRKRTYVISENTGNLLSYFQGSVACERYFNHLIIFSGIEDIKRYFMGSNHYLPRRIIGSAEKQIQYTDAIEEIHNHRINNKQKGIENIVLSICIPTYNRGHRAYDNVIHTLKSELDMEIEVIVSNNGTKNDSKEYYDKISRLKDSRLTYFEFEANKGATLNFCQVIDLAKGKYVLLLSDEDQMDLKQLKYVVSILEYYQGNLSVVRTKTDGQGLVPFIGLASSAKDSLFKFMLTSNYMSGIIFNKELLQRERLTMYIRKGLQNQACLYYPHMVWELVLCQYGNVLGLDVILINEGKAEKTDTSTLKIGKTQGKEITEYATIEGRLAQHKGFYDVIKDLEISKRDFDMFRELYRKLYNKTFFLVYLSINVHYKETDVDVDQLLEVAYKDVIGYLEGMYKGKKNFNKYKYRDDMKEIKRHYIYYKELL